MLLGGTSFNERSRCKKYSTCSRPIFALAWFTFWYFHWNASCVSLENSVVTMQIISEATNVPSLMVKVIFAIIGMPYSVHRSMCCTRISSFVNILFVLQLSLAVVLWLCFPIFCGEYWTAELHVLLSRRSTQPESHYPALRLIVTISTRSQFSFLISRHYRLKRNTVCLYCETLHFVW